MITLVAAVLPSTTIGIVFRWKVVSIVIAVRSEVNGLLGTAVTVPVKLAWSFVLESAGDAIRMSVAHTMSVGRGDFRPSVYLSDFQGVCSTAFFSEVGCMGRTNSDTTMSDMCKPKFTPRGLSWLK